MSSFFLLVVIIDGDGMIATMKFLALPKKMIVNPVSAKPIFGNLGGF